jgi:molybdopterin/thiamine biosynthesis adenylyltransferase
MFPQNSGMGRIAQAGADVDRIRRSSVLIKVGDLPAGRLILHPLWPVARSLAAVGFRRTCVRGAIDFFDELEEAIPDGGLDQAPGLLVDARMAGDLPDVDVVVDLSNDPASRSFSAALAAERSCPLLCLWWGDAWLAVTSSAEAPGDLPSSGPGEPCAAISRMVAGVALQEVLIVLGAAAEACPLNGFALYDARQADASRAEVLYRWHASRIQDTVIDVVGMGGIGIHFLESFVPLLGRGCTVRLFDFDRVSEENLSSQVAYRERDLGHSKAEVMADALQRYAGDDVSLEAYPVPYQEQPVTQELPALRVLAPDNFSVRLFTNRLSLGDGVAIAEAGSTPLAAQQRTYLPEWSSCLEHRIRDLEGKAGSERRAQSCLLSPAPTLPGTNAVIGGLLAFESLCSLRPRIYGYPARGTLTYDCRFPARFGMVDVKPPCRHDTSAPFCDAAIKRRNPC